MSCCDCSTRDGREALRSELALTRGDGDVWGWTLGWNFAIADVLQVTDPTLIPDSWQYRPAPSLLTSQGADDLEEDYQSATLLDLLDEGLVTSADLVYWGNTLARYAGLCKAAGRYY